ncbi:MULTISPECIES: hypothetical protein [unclassified Bradyrhizobium]|uniref:hypothetical protein n=1 Tax=unclassified Bradyrhizobium TaxID=2631580 RepID=UPI0028E7B6B1|nr:MULTISPECIES: hypothetical protein [unclassified Bradyrhizobium]
MSSPHIVIVGADKGGVGKTTISRLLVDYYKSHGITLRAFDTEHPVGVLKRFHPSLTEIVNLEESDDQMKVFDGLHEAQVTLIDIRAGLLSKTLEKLKLLGFFDGLRDGSLRISVVHVIGSNKASFDEIDVTRAAVQDAKHHVVLNHTNKSRFHGLPPTVNDPIVIGLLDELAASTVDGLDMGFSAYVGDVAKQSRVLRGYVNTWEREGFKAFDAKALNAI